MKINRKRIVSILIFSIPLLLFASDSNMVSYEDLKLSMQTGNAELRKADQVVYQSSLDVKNAKAGYHPTIDLTLSGTFMVNPPIGKITMSTDELLSQMGMPSSSLGAANGGYVTLYDGMENTYYSTGLSITQPLITWGKIPNSVKVYQALQDIRIIERQDKEDKLSVELTTRLSALKYMDEILLKLDETKALAEELIKTSEAAYDNGILLKQDVVEAQLSALELDVNKAEVEKEYSSVLQGIRTITGNSELESSDIDFTVNENRIQIICNYDRSVLREKAVSKETAALRMLDKQSTALAYKKKIDKASMYGVPDFALVVNASYGGSRFPLIETGWYQHNDYGLTITLGIKTTLWDGGKKLNALRADDSAIKAAEADYDAAKAQLAAACEENITALDLALSKLEYLDLKKEAALDRLSLLKQQFEIGTISNVDVLKQEIEVKKIEIELLQQKIVLAQSAYTLSYLCQI